MSLQDELRYALVTGVNTQSGPFLSGGTENVAAGYARANVAVTDALTFEVGARARLVEVGARRCGAADQGRRLTSARAPRCRMRAGRYQLQASAYYANRTPSLNELHRRFAVGNQITNANPLLDPETLTGVEGGVLTQFARASVRATAFFNNLDGAIANVTLSQTPTQIIRQRQNSDTIRATGVEIEARYALHQHAERERPDRVHVEPFPRLGGDAGDRGQRRAAGAEGAGRRGADLGRSALVHRGDAGALQRRAVRRRPQYRRRSCWAPTACGMRPSAARSSAA